MAVKFVIDAEVRALQGTGASRRLRRTGFVPAIVYGGKEEPKMISVNHNELWKNLKHEAFYSHILTLKIGGETEQVVLKDLHRHPVREAVLHMDLQRVLPDVAIRMRIPVHFKGADVAPGVKTGGGIVEHLLNEIEVECLPRFLPESFDLDLSAMELNEAIHLSQLPLPEGVTLVQLAAGNDQAVVSLHVPKVAEEEPEPAAAEAPAAAPAGKGGKAAPAPAKAAAPAPKKK